MSPSELLREAQLKLIAAYGQSRFTDSIDAHLSAIEAQSGEQEEFHRVQTALMPFFGEGSTDEDWGECAERIAYELAELRALPAAQGGEPADDPENDPTFVAWKASRPHLYGAQTAQAKPAEQRSAQEEERRTLQLIDERDKAEEMADDLAAQIAAITDVEIGEHSSANDPWRNAMLAADEFIAEQIRKLATPPALSSEGQRLAEDFALLAEAEDFAQFADLATPLKEALSRVIAHGRGAGGA